MDALTEAVHDKNSGDSGKQTRKFTGNKKRTLKEKWRLTSLPNKVMIGATAVIAFATVANVLVAHEQWSEMHSGGKDTHDLAVAAKTQAEASKTQAEEAKDQVEKLTESLKKTDKLIAEQTTQANATLRQANETNALARQAQRSADYAQQAIKTSVDSERPWIGVGSFTVDNFVEGHTAKININFTNSGKRPASASAFYTATIVKSLPSFPDFSKTERGVAFVLPGASFGGVFEYEVPANAFSEWRRTQKTFFVVAEIVYTDVGTNTAYITHYCAYYNPANKNQLFPLCTRYNEAK